MLKSVVTCLLFCGACRRAAPDPLASHYFIEPSACTLTSSAVYGDSNVVFTGCRMHLDGPLRNYDWQLIADANQAPGTWQGPAPGTLAFSTSADAPLGRALSMTANPVPATAVLSADDIAATYTPADPNTSLLSSGAATLSVNYVDWTGNGAELAAALQLTLMDGTTLSGNFDLVAGTPYPVTDSGDDGDEDSDEGLPAGCSSVDCGLAWSLCNEENDSGCSAAYTCC